MYPLFISIIFGQVRLFQTTNCSQSIGTMAGNWEEATILILHPSTIYDLVQPSRISQLVNPTERISIDPNATKKAYIFDGVFSIT